MSVDFGAMFIPTIPWLEKVLRPVIVYAAILVVIHLAGKRELAQVNSFDLVVVLLISNVVQNATIGDDNSILGGIVGAAALVGANHLVVRFLFNRARLDRVLEGPPTVLIRDGEILEPDLRRELVTEDELRAALRRQGVADPSEVEQAVLETSGVISVIQKPSPIDAQRHAELVARLDELARDVRALGQGAPAAG